MDQLHQLIKLLQLDEQLIKAACRVSGRAEFFGCEMCAPYSMFPRGAALWGAALTK